jgi:hypothetical protein
LLPKLYGNKSRRSNASSAKCTGAGEQCYVTYAERLYIRKESLRRCGYSKDPNVALRFCCKLKFETKTDYVDVQIPKQDGRMETRRHHFSFKAPKPDGTKSLFLLPAKKGNRGGALQRRKIVKVEALVEGTKKSGAEGELASASRQFYAHYP